MENLSGARDANDRMLQRAIAIVEAAAARGLVVRVLGGCGILLRVGELHEWLMARGRRAGDVDFVCRRSDRLALPDLMASLGYTEDARLNALHGRVRNVFLGQDGAAAWEADFFFDQLPMCHVLDFSGRLDLDPVTLSPVDLLLAKLQIVELNEKDVLDVASLLATHPTGAAGDRVIDVRRIVDLTRTDWGLFHTVEMNLHRTESRLGQLGLDDPWRGRAAEALGEIRLAINAAPKSRRWKLRERVGERVRWYNLVEDARR